MLDQASHMPCNVPSLNQYNLLVRCRHSATQSAIIIVEVMKSLFQSCLYSWVKGLIAKIYIFNVYIYILEEEKNRKGRYLFPNWLYLCSLSTSIKGRLAVLREKRTPLVQVNLAFSNISSYFYPLTFPQKYSTSRALQILIYVLKFRVASNLCLRGYAFLILHSLQFWSFFIASMSNISYRKGQG